MHVLIAEDDTIVSEILSSLLEPLGHEVDVAETCDAALEMLDSEVYALLLTSPTMALGCGMGLVEHIKAAQPDIVAVVVTGWRETEHVASVDSLKPHDHRIRSPRIDGDVKGQRVLPLDALRLIQSDVESIANQAKQRT